MDKISLLKEDFKNAVLQLESALARISDDPLIQAGCIQYFEFCFELAWKTVKQAVTDQGLADCYSPKACLQQAFAMGWIENEKIWLDMLEARNRMTHTYNQAAAMKIYARLTEFLREFQNLDKRLITI